VAVVREAGWFILFVGLGLFCLFGLFGFFGLSGFLVERN